MIKFNFLVFFLDGNLTHGLYNIPSNASIGDSVCQSKTVQAIQLTWGPNSSKQSFLMFFDNKNDSIVLSSIQIHLTVLTEDFPDAKGRQKLFKTIVHEYIKTRLVNSFRKPNDSANSSRYWGIQSAWEDVVPLHTRTDAKFNRDCGFKTFDWLD